MLMIRTRYEITGIVQGVGFRPFVYRLAHDLSLTGWVRNTPAGVEIEVQGSAGRLTDFENSLQNKLPPLAVVSSQISSEIVVIDEESSFAILPSGTGRAEIQIAPDTAICSDCLREMNDPADRRHRYPFITCTNCGPRYSIITGIPYDRPKTTMAAFPLCSDCQKEYLDPMNRRFHAQPIACHICGPQLSLLNSVGEIIAARDEAVTRAVELLERGAILAIKGIGSYHLAVDACNQGAVQRLRTRKKRDEKPFAVMAADIAAARSLSVMDDTEERLLTSPESPIVIVRKRPDSPLSDLVAPANGWIGLMLPYAPLHHLLFRVQGSRFDVPGSMPVTTNFEPRTALTALVMTSGNISDEPVAYEDQDALKRLAEIADYFLLHDRPIHIRSDDSVMRVFQDKPLFYRRSRGYAPRAVRLPFQSRPILAAGAELKGAVCFADRDLAFVSQHIGDLQNDSTCDSFRHTIAHLSEILEINPEIIACDLHPDYLSTRFAEESGLPLIQVQHHHAHQAACMAENGLNGPTIGVILDGTGYGADGTIWGGEFLVGGYSGYSHAARFRPTRLPGGDAAVREPWRMALSYLYDSLGDDTFKIAPHLAMRLAESDQGLFTGMLERGINSPLTSSCGRLFDAVAALLNIRHFVSYDGQAAIELEALAETAETEFPIDSFCQSGKYHYEISSNEEVPIELNFSPIFPEILSDMFAGIQPAVIARHFHITVASAVVDVCLQIGNSSGLDRVVLSGGVFQNRLLSEMVYTSLAERGFKVFTHRLVPPNDGGIALGQAAIAAHAL